MKLSHDRGLTKPKKFGIQYGPSLLLLQTMSFCYRSFVSVTNNEFLLPIMRFCYRTFFSLTAHYLPYGQDPFGTIFQAPNEPATLEGEPRRKPFLNSYSSVILFSRCSRPSSSLPPARPVPHSHRHNTARKLKLPRIACTPSPGHSTAYKLPPLKSMPKLKTCVV